VLNVSKTGYDREMDDGDGRANRSLKSELRAVGIHQVVGSFGITACVDDMSSGAKVELCCSTSGEAYRELLSNIKISTSEADAVDEG
jgi:hypothetical protein